MLGAGYIPKLHWTDALANSEGLFAYYRYAEASFILTCRTPDGTGSGWAGTTGLKDVSKIDAAALTEIAADKALKSRKPRALEPGNYTVILEPRPAARFLSLMLFALNARAGGRRPQLHERQGARRDQARSEGLRRQRHDPQRRRQSRSCARRRSARTASPRAPSPGSKRASSRTCSTTATGRRSRTSRSRRPSPQQSLVMDGGDATIDQMVKSTKRGLLVTLLLVHPAGRSDDAAQHRHDARRDVPDRERRNRRAGAELPLERRPRARLQQHLDARPRRCRCTSAKPTTIPGTALVPAMKIEDFRMTSISPAV